MARATRTFRVEFIGDSKALERAFERLDGSSSKLAKRARQAATAAGAAISTAAVASVKAAIDYESAFAGVRKTVDATEAEFQRLSTGIRRMSREIPVAATELAGIAESAGQLGIQNKHILKFTRVMADLGVATNLSGEEAATTLARLANITQMNQRDFDRLGSTIVDLGNNFATTESEIADFALRIAGAGKVVGLTEPQILAISTALSSVGIEAEAGGTAVSQALQIMAKAAKSGGSQLEGFARVAGMSGDEFRRRFEKDAAGAFVAFVEGLGRMQKSGENVFQTLQDLGLNGVRLQRALLSASGAGDLLRRALDRGQEAWKENNALTKEAEQRYKTTASQLQILRNTVVDIGITVGSVLLPVVNDATGAVSRFLSQVIEGEGAGGRFRDVLGQVGSALFGVGQSLAPVIGGVARFAAGVLQSRGGVALLATAIGALTGRLVALGAVWAVGKVVAFTQAIAALGRQLMLVAGTALVQLRTGLIGAGASLGALAGPIGLVVGGLTGLGVALFGMKRASDASTYSVQQLSDALRAQDQALRELEGHELDAMQRQANLRSANVALARAAQHLKDTIDEYGEGSLQAEEAAAQLEQAIISQARAADEAARAEEDGKRKRDEYRESTERAHTELGRHADALTTLKGKLRDEQRELEKTELMHGKNSAAARVHRERIEELRKEISGLESKEIDVKVALQFVGEKVGQLDLGLGGGSGGPSFEESAKAEISAHVKELAKRGAVPLGAIGGAGSLGALAGVAAQFGLGVTSGFRPGDKGWHGKNRARDFAGSQAGMLRFAQLLAASMGGRLLELIHTPLGFGIKNGRRVPLSFWGPRVNADHYDHVHVAMQRGGSVPGVGTGDRVPALLEPGEFVLNRRAVEAIGPRFLADLNDRVARFQRGGLVGRARTIARAARAAGFTGRALKMAIAIALAESGGDPRAIGDGGASHGAWQIHRPSHPRWATRNLLDLGTNARAAFQISRGGRDWSAWTTFRTGAHRRFLAVAREAAIGSGRRAGSGRGDRRILPGGLPREFEQQQAVMEMTLAGLEARGATTEEWLDALREQRHHLKRRNARIVRRLREIDAALKRPLTRRTRRRLKEERLRLVQERAALLGDLQRNKEAIMERADPAAPIREEIERGTPGLNAQSALAALTPDVGDDITAAQQAVTFWQDILAKAQAAGDAGLIAEAAQNLKQAADHLQSLTPTAMDFASRDLALAQLTDTLADDLAALRNMERLAEQQLQAALQTADPRDDIEAATLLRQIRDQIKSLQEQQERDARAMYEEMKRQRDDANSRYQALRANQSSLAAAISAVVSGEIGGRIGLGSQTPKVLAAYA